ncbi:MAG: hypothetical protein EPN21_07810 [Methylococcaceae bacterium]|nr:MAG: hypothetical protein EPN21_07810 [Methylococcaceae bacterium]
MAASITDPHDSFFRETFSRREVAEGFLQSYLPPAVAARIDWSSLEVAKDSFIEKALRKHFSDLIYNARYGEHDIKVCLLLEHKSHPDIWVSLQLLRYLVRIWELHHKQRPGQKLPPIVPLVLYHGTERWRIPDVFLALFGELDEPLVSYIPAFRYELCDLNLPKPEEIRGTVLSRLILLALKRVFDPDPKRVLAELLPLVQKILSRETALEMLEVLLRYYVQTSETLDEKAICELIDATANGENTMQTFIDRYIEQGRQQERLNARAELLLHLMTRKFGMPSAEHQRRIKQADEACLLRWAEQVLFAETPDETLR